MSSPPGAITCARWPGRRWTRRRSQGQWDPNARRARIFHVPHTSSSGIRWLPAATVIAASALMGPVSAEADIAVTGRTPGVARPGESVKVVVGSGAPRSPVEFPISLVPLDLAPNPVPCGPNALCAPAAPGPPRIGPFVYVGRAELLPNSQPPIHRYRLGFRVPHLEPGRYAFVVYCGGCQPGPRGSLIVSTQVQDDLLRVIKKPVPASSDRRAESASWEVGAGALVLALGGTVLLIRRRGNRARLRADSTSR
jgi:hypothetical protein